MDGYEKMRSGAERLQQFATGYAIGVVAVTNALTRHCEDAFADLAPEPPQERPDWADVAQFADISAECERARATAVRLEQELAEKQRELDDARANLVKGALMSVLMQSRMAPGQSATWCVRQAGEKLGVTL
ncbi:hypothetical protein B4915_02200 [Leucobacter massiliensis]|uniref:Uncharacterized protein n=2 Tax=Leucobacter massiliensis TaxID=1686285 RepID=A0A2S9QQN5_9MICO|nr:hypothetical protein B4915_02200 [Leucobacter massiliensis]